MNVDEILAVVSNTAAFGQPVYLVGGAVRDRILGRALHDLDFVTQGNTRQLARQVADHLGAAFYPLDEERGTYRVTSDETTGEAMMLDFASLRGQDLLADLKARDFTINAMAMDISRPEETIDPCGGMEDLAGLVLRACGPTNVLDDPVRALRAVRMVITFGLWIDEDTQSQISQSAQVLQRTSIERLRDEFFKILDCPSASEAIGRMDAANLLAVLLPDLVGLKGLIQSPPHVYEGWTHTRMLVKRLEELWQLLVEGQMPAAADPADQRTLELAFSELGRFQHNLQSHFAASIAPLRSLRALTFIAGLYHDCAKPLTRSVDPDGRIRFFNHEQIGADITIRQAKTFALSNLEIDRLERVVRGHMRVHQMADDPHGLSARTIYRFFRDTQLAGIDIGLLSLADTWATCGPELSPERWMAELSVCKALFSAYWDQPAKVVAPPRLITGVDLIEILGLTPGPKIGRILEAVREGQAVGQVTDREEALTLARGLLDEV